MPNTDIPCYHCQNMKFRFLYPTGDNAQGDTDIIVAYHAEQKLQIILTTTKSLTTKNQPSIYTYFSVE